MATVKVRFEKSKTINCNRGSIYYRIYMGHNNRFEFSSKIQLDSSEWDEENKVILGEENELYRIQVKQDVVLLEMIIENLEKTMYGKYKAIDVANKFRKIKSIIE